MRFFRGDAGAEFRRALHPHQACPPRPPFLRGSSRSEASTHRGRFPVHPWLQNAEATFLATPSPSRPFLPLLPSSSLQARACSSGVPGEGGRGGGEASQNEGGHGELEVLQEDQKQGAEKGEGVEKAKKVYGIDKGLPPKVVAQFTDAVSLCKLKPSDVNKMFRFSEKDQARYLPEGLPECLFKEFEFSKGRGLLLREQVLKLISHVHSLVETTDFFEQDKLNAVGQTGSHDGGGMPDKLSGKDGIQESSVELLELNEQEGMLVNPLEKSEVEMASSPSENLAATGEIKESDTVDAASDTSARMDASMELPVELTELEEKEDALNEPVSFDINGKVENQLPASNEKTEMQSEGASLSSNQQRRQAKLRRFLTYANLGSRKQIVLDGLPGCGKSVALAMLVLWARMKGWLVIYVPSGKKWTQDDQFCKNGITKLWDTPRQAISVLENMIKSHGNIFSNIFCRILEPIILGEAPGMGTLPGRQTVPVREGSTLKSLIQFGIQTPHAAVGVVVRVRKELSLVKEIPVLIAIDEFNSWFTFSRYHDRSGEFARVPIHAKDLAMVQTYRDMMSDETIIVAAFSHSTAVGKLPKKLPVVPELAKVFIDRYNFHEACIMMKYYKSQLKSKLKTGKRMKRNLYVLTNGNGNELREISVLRRGF